MDGQQSLEVLVRLILALATARPMDKALTEVTVAAVHLLALSGAGAMLSENGRLSTRAATGDIAEVLEDCQQRTQSGPCRDAIALAQIVTAANLNEAAPRWPQFAVAARRVGVAAVAAVPIPADQTVVGALNLYAPLQRHWGPEELTMGEILTGLASGYVRHATALRESEQLAGQLQTALASRVVIEQAKGMVAGAHHITIADAFERIRRHARSKHTSVRTVSEAIVAAGLRV
jgi:GAF domain-containing protein